MSERRIERWFEGTLRPTFPDRPHLLSSRVPWSGFLIERDPCHEGHADSIVWPRTELVMVDTGGIWIKYRAFGVSKRFFAGAGSITIWPATHESRCHSWVPLDASYGPTEITSLELDASALKLLAVDGVDRLIPLQHAVHDDALASLVRLAEAEVRTGCASGRLYGESLCMALATRMLRQYAVASSKARPPRAGLTTQQCQRVRDHIHAHLDGDLSLATLAHEAGLSAQQLLEAFRKTFGTTPHQYILRERINYAKRLLATQPVSIADVALTVGFSTQSHFTAAFRRAVGVTPRRFRVGL
jgi:AraC family transcriptional regulator